MPKVTRIAYSHNINQGKLDQLIEMARRLGVLRSEIWNEFGSLKGVGMQPRAIRDGWLADGKQFDVAARLWKETLRDTMADIETYREAAKAKVRQAIHKRTKNKKERKRLFTLLKYDRWMEDPYLSRMMRKYYKHGHTQVRNQIVLDTGCYTTFVEGGKAWVKVMGLERGKRIAVPLNTTFEPTGTLRLIIRNGRVEVHYAVDVEKACVTRPCGEGELGIDKGYTEAFIDSDGDPHGEGLGEILSVESDHNKVKYQRRNKLKAIADKKPHKRENILKNNLGRKKLDERKRKHSATVRNLVFNAAHSVVDKAETVACEDLTPPIKGKSFGKNQNRRLSGWVKGTMAEAIESVSQRRGSSLSLVNPAYTSQTDSRHGVLMGDRKGDWFHCFDGVVLQADQNAAQNILDRMYDTEIHLYTPYTQVKAILLERTEQFKQRLGLLNHDSSYTPQPIQLSLWTLTESELPHAHP